MFKRLLLLLLLLTPSPHDSSLYPTLRFHPTAVAAARRWAQAHDVVLVDIEQAAQRGLDNGWVNADGMHWGWQTHAEIAGMVSEALRAASVP